MRLTIHCQVYWPDNSAVAQMITAVAEDTAKAGHAVTVVTSRKGYNLEETYPETDTQNGVKIVRVGGAKLNRHSAFGRLANYFSFILLSGIALFRLPRADGLVITSAPPFSLAPACALKWLRRTPFVYVIEDLYPEIVFRSGMLRQESLAGKLLSAVFGFFMRSAAETIVLGDHMKRRVLRSHPSLRPESLHPIHNWQDGDLLRPLPRNGAEGARNRPFRLQYSGNLGQAHDIETLLAAMEALKGNTGLHFQFIGRGKRRQELETRARENKIENCSFEDYVPTDKLGESLNSADVCLVTLAKGFEGLIVPSKIYGIMAVGKPVIFIGALEGEIPEIIRGHSIGWVVEEGDVQGLVRAIQEAQTKPELLEGYGRSSRTAFEAHFNRRISTNSYVRVFELLDSPARPPAARNSRTQH